ncbi:MAG: 2,3-bisphosphoglycerate-independent phosphoglycerate mutase [Mycoplasmoidaceae bacterium]
MKKPVLLAILDGYGIAPKSNMNAISLANKPTLDKLLSGEYPYAELEASGSAVGLPEGQIGNSEVGHLNIGAGRVVYTGLSLINKDVKDDNLKNNEGLIKAIKNAKDNNSKFHIMGLISPGGVHSHEEHIFALMRIASMNGLQPIVHLFTDGRDVPPRSVKSSIEKLNIVLKETNGIIGSIAGRYYAMDRDKRWDRVQKAYDVLIGKTNTTFTDINKYIDEQYEADINDEFFTPTINANIDKVKIDNNDSIIFANFRPDRARELSHLIIGSNYYDYENKNKKTNLFFATMMKYEGIEPNFVLFPPTIIKNTIGEVIANNGLSQLRIAETEKYAHVTFFMDGGVEVDFPREDKILIDSPKVNTYDEAYKMSAEGITNRLLEVMQNYDLIILNFANPDMLGHTGNMEKTILAIEWIDEQVKRIWDKINELGGTMFLTADHGNAESMLDEKGNVITAHTTNLVPFVCTDKNILLKKSGNLSNISSTILQYIMLDIPIEMTSGSLLVNK